MLDYESLKAMAKSIGRPIKDLLALSPVNDPFYAGVGRRGEARNGLPPSGPIMARSAPICGGCITG